MYLAYVSGESLGPMRCTYRGILCLLFLAGTLLPSRVVAQLSAEAVSFSLGGVDLSLGMPKRLALLALNRSYTVDSLSIGWMVTSHDSPPVPIGSVHFTSGRLSTIIRDWSPRDSRQASAVLSILGALHMLINGTDCRVEHHSGNEPGFVMESAKVVCGSHMVSIALYQPHQGQASFLVSESLQAVRDTLESNR